jgi:spoIIIJ-associated protein
MDGSNSLEERVRAFVGEVVAGMSLALEVGVERLADGIRVNLEGTDAEPLLRRRGEALDALQHVVNVVFRDALPAGHRLVVDCQGFRRAKDRELQQMARFLMDKVRATGLPQELGPLNSYARRLVHLEVATAPDLVSESQGEGATKRVIISPRRPAVRR